MLLNKHRISIFRLFASCFVVCIFITGCEDEYPFDPQDSVPVAPTDSLSASQFPTAEGDSWQYTSTDGEHTYTIEVAGTKYISSYTTRRMESDSDIPVDDFVWLDQLYQAGSITLPVGGLPIRTSFFTKDLDSYTERAIDFWVETWGSTIFQKIIPGRVLWSFPLELGKEWTVLKSYTVPEIKYTRKVVSTDEVITVPAGTFKNVFYVEEYSSIAGSSDDAQTPDKYWLAPDVGIIKYEYLDPFFGFWQLPTLVWQTPLPYAASAL